MKKFVWILAAALLLGCFVVAERVEAQRTKGKTRIVLTRQLMTGFVNAHCSSLQKALDATETDWHEVALHAALLNEAGHLLMDDGRCPDGEWAKAAKALQTTSLEVLEKVREKDLNGAKWAVKDLTSQSCAVCHEAHKPKPRS